MVQDILWKADSHSARQTTTFFRDKRGIWIEGQFVGLASGAWRSSL